MDFVGILVTGLVVSSSLVIVSKLPIGVEIDSYSKAITTAIVFGILNALLLPIIRLFFAIPNFLTLGLLSGIFAFIANIIIFSVAAALVPGFELRRGFVSAVLGALALSLVTSLANSFVYGLA